MYHKRFGFEHDLFRAFCADRPERQSKFVSFIGRMFVAGDNKQANELAKKESLVRDRLRTFWEWAVENSNSAEMLKEFGYWVSLEKDLFGPQWLTQRVLDTLKKTDGVLEWDRGLTKTVGQLAESAPEQTLEILRLYLLEGGVRGRNLRMPFLYRDYWSNAIKTLYGHTAMQAEVRKLISDLMREGGKPFWPLEEIVKEDAP